MTWWVWLVLAIVQPLPYFAIEVGRGTVLQLLLFALPTGAMAATEPSFITAFVAVLFWAQALLYALLLWIAVRALGRRLPAMALVVAVALLVALCAAVPVYRTPFSNTGSTATLLELY
jgi:hypothetical protein